MKRKGFTLVELLVVISIIALLMAILMPVLAKVKAIANQMVCGTNLSGIGKGMTLYSGDNEDEYPMAGGRQPKWSANPQCIKSPFSIDPTTDPPYGTSTTGNSVTVSSSLYLLVKYADMGPRQFVCKGDIGTTEFKLADYTTAPTTNFELTDAWDFGEKTDGLPGTHCSYSYHMPYWASAIPISKTVGFPISPAGNPSSPLCADRNLYADKNAADYRPTKADGSGKNTKTNEDYPSWQGTSPGNYLDRYKTGNSASHQRNGQNVLFNDIHVSFEKYPNVGINQDNIWIYWGGAVPAKPQEYQLTGTIPKVGQGAPYSEKDALLVNEVNP